MTLADNSCVDDFNVNRQARTEQKELLSVLMISIFYPKNKKKIKQHFVDIRSDLFY